MPLDMSDEELEVYCSGETIPRSYLGASRASMTASFLAFARLCRIAGRIQQLNSPRRIRDLASGDPNKTQKFASRLATYDRLLRSWEKGLPNAIRFSKLVSDWNPDGNPHAAMSAIMFIVYAGCIMNLYRYACLDI